MISDRRSAAERWKAVLPSSPSSAAAPSPCLARAAGSTQIRARLPYNNVSSVSSINLWCPWQGSNTMYLPPRHGQPIRRRRNNHKSFGGLALASSKVQLRPSARARDRRTRVTPTRAILSPTRQSQVIPQAEIPRTTANAQARVQSAMQPG